MMTSRSASTDVLFTRIFVIPNDVSFTFFRKTNGEQYITCVPIGGASNIPLIISVEEFFNIIESLEAWIKAEYVSSVTSSLDEIRSDSLSGCNRIDVAFTASDNVKSIDVRNYWKPNDAVTFMRTCIGFTVQTSANITALFNMKNDLKFHLKVVAILEDLIHIAHGVIYDIYTETYGSPYNAVYRNALITISQDTFTSLLYERMSAVESSYAEKWFSVAEGIYTYILSKDVESLERYIELTQLESYVR